MGNGKGAAQEGPYESLMTYQVTDTIHDVKLYSDDTGHGQTACGIKVYPWHNTAVGTVTCKKCQEERRKHA